VAAARHAARRLDELLLAPLAPDLGDRDLVVVPTGALHALPWSVLPSCASRAVVVAPSASLWRRAAEATAAGTGALLVSGPDLPAAAAEIDVLARRYPEATVLAGGDATADRVTAAMEGRAMLHLAAHGRFRSDNPLFSALCLADGPLHVYDLEAIRRPPPRVVLAACDSGLSSVRPGDELMGLAAALLALGTRTLVACVLPVPDGATRALMLAFHDELCRGAEPATALAAARKAAAGDAAEDLVAGAAFACFGHG
jgi:CHAT domain-containing protein